jgi:hypothetical protein
MAHRECLPSVGDESESGRERIESDSNTPKTGDSNESL